MNNMVYYFIEVLVFFAAFLAVFAANAVLHDLVRRGRKRVSDRLDEELRLQQRELARASPLFGDLSRLAAEWSDEEGGEASLWTRFQTFVQQSGLRITPQRLLGIILAVGLSLGVVVGLAVRSASLGVLATLVAASVPLLVVQTKRHRRLEKLRAQLPDAFDLMGRVLRAGQTMSQALQGVGDEFQPPLGLEFGYCYEQQNLGLPPETALRDLGRRTGMLEIKIFVLAVMVHRQTGGNLSELLEKLATVVRDRFRIRGMIKTLTAEGRLQAAVLLALPIFMYVMMLILNREYALVLLQYPALPVGTLISMGFGALWIRKIISFDF
ncbi:MAG: type II secretion system F family protein [Planctomycetes bacterium]|nr:type II secretion system F family protein [Planctomycetota bacterium]